MYNQNLHTYLEAFIYTTTLTYHKKNHTWRNHGSTSSQRRLYGYCFHYVAIYDKVLVLNERDFSFKNFSFFFFSSTVLFEKLFFDFFLPLLLFYCRLLCT